MELVDGWQDGEEGAKLAMILEQACIDQRVGKSWRECGEADLKRDLPHRALDHDSYVL